MTSLHFSLSCIGEGNGNPFQCSCLENPRDGGAWWAAICGVSQSQTQLKQLSSSRARLLEKAMAPHSSTLAWKIPWTEEPWWAAVLGITKSRTRLSDFTFTFHFHALEKAMATHSNTLAWRLQGKGSLVGCHLWGRTESDATEATWQQQVSFIYFCFDFYDFSPLTNFGFCLFLFL